MYGLLHITFFQGDQNAESQCCRFDGRQGIASE